MTSSSLTHLTQKEPIMPISTTFTPRQIDLDEVVAGDPELPRVIAARDEFGFLS